MHLRMFWVGCTAAYVFLNDILIDPLHPQLVFGGDKSHSCTVSYGLRRDEYETPPDMAPLLYPSSIIHPHFALLISG